MIGIRTRLLRESGKRSQRSLFYDDCEVRRVEGGITPVIRVDEPVRAFLLHRQHDYLEGPSRQLGIDVLEMVHNGMVLAKQMVNYLV